MVFDFFFHLLRLDLGRFRKAVKKALFFDGANSPRLGSKGWGTGGKGEKGGGLLGMSVAFIVGIVRR